MARGRAKKARFNHSVMTTSSAIVNDDILFNIFLRLPVKSILRFRSVCKSWRQLLFDPLFIQTHVDDTNRHCQCHERLLVQSTSRTFYSVDLEESSKGNAVLINFPLRATSDIKVLGSCNGLLCLLMEFLELVLWNPSTGNYKKLPAVQPPVEDDYQTVGLGYDSSLDDYKMVRIIRIGGEYRVDMYSLKGNSWKIIGNIPDHKIFRDNDHGHGLCLNGSIYWKGHHNIIRFDLKNEKFSKVPWRRRDMQHVYSRGGLLVKGRYLGFHYTRQNGDLVVLVLKENRDNKEEWVQLMTIPSKCVQTRLGSTYKALQPVCFWKNGKVLLYKVEPTKKISRNNLRDNLFWGKFLVYDPKRSSILEDFPIGGISGMCWKRMTYNESLVSPNFA
ncbi:hypothetical protein LguiB_032491 [Lonicera macranthoides]